MMRKTYLLQDPYDTDAIAFMQAIFTDFGLRPTCFYTDPKARYYGEREYPILRSKAVEASFDADLDDVADLVRRVTEHHDVVGIVPYREDTVEVAAEVLKHVDIGANSAEVLARCRDKFAMKQHLANGDPAVRVPQSFAVRTFDDVAACGLSSRFVLKPNSGMGSTNLGIFSGTDDRDAIEKHLELDPKRDWVAEEFIEGIEYRVSGLVRRDATVQTLAVFQYIPFRVDERFTMAYGAESQIASTDERFGILQEYAESAIRALGICGLPFHMEVKIDDQGPALIDFGARVASESTGHLLSQMHPDRPNMYSVAGHDYIGPNRFAMDPVDYAHYDSGTSMLVYGISDIEGIIRSLDGFDEIEAMPEFVSWPVRPHVGDPIRAMRKLRDSPYIVVLRHDGSLERTLELVDHVRRTIRINERSELSTRARGVAVYTAGRARRKARWLAHRLWEADRLRRLR